MGTTPQSIQSLLHTATPDIADLIGRARFLERMRQSLLEILPEAAGPHVRVAAYEGYRLRLHVTHAGWATRLRYMQPAIVQALAQRMRLHIEGVEIKVRPDLTPAPPPEAVRTISDTARAHLRRSASYIADKQLADALARLAEAGRRDDG
ncbi:hypothetical protein C84B14_15446 [Salinisphaera sp. C84B14]|uniref:DUF721 domain-containing protein n=1 Tax=Salinisphaera sp. C84B14 TaxID=1304155 RepID=UPI0032B19838|tara:strand:+ start:2682 stop:3131 length:450 start_codon:yes stop_codon:yes gene_type:complete